MSDFQAKITELLARSAALSLDARDQVIEMLDAARKEIIVRLSDLESTSFQKAQLTLLKSQIDQIFEKFRAQATPLIEGYEEKSFVLGEQAISEPLLIIGGDAIGQISKSTLQEAEKFTADLITHLSADSAAKINLAIQRAFLVPGADANARRLQIGEVIQEVGKAIGGDQGFTGLFNGIGRRATMITLNEILRVNSIAAQARLMEAASRQPDIQKQWRHLNLAMVPRPGHIAADGQVVDVNKPFLVEGEELMYPRDPNGSPGNTINCHCMMAPYFSPDTLKPNAKQKGLLESLGISVTAA
jgi:hypothetical protein